MSDSIHIALSASKNFDHHCSIAIQMNDGTKIRSCKVFDAHKAPAIVPEQTKFLFIQGVVLSWQMKVSTRLLPHASYEVDLQHPIFSSPSSIFKARLWLDVQRMTREKGVKFSSRGKAILMGSAVDEEDHSLFFLALKTQKKAGHYTRIGLIQTSCEARQSVPSRITRQEYARFMQTKESFDHTIQIVKSLPTITIRLG